MSRLVQEEVSPLQAEAVQAKSQKAAKPAKSKKEQYFERVAKYIPAEIVAAYVAAVGAVAQLPDLAGRRVWYSVAFIGGVVGTPLYLRMFGDPSKSKTMHLVVSTIAFVVWSYSLGGFFKDVVNWYEPGIAEAAAMVFSLAVGFLKPGAKWLGLGPQPQTA